MWSGVANAWRDWRAKTDSSGALHEVRRKELAARCYFNPFYLSLPVCRPCPLLNPFLSPSLEMDQHRLTVPPSQGHMSVVTNLPECSECGTWDCRVVDVHFYQRERDHED